IEQHVAPAGERLLDRRARRPVTMAEDLGPFEQLAVADHGLEAPVIDEMIVLPVPLARALGPRRYRDRQDDRGIVEQQMRTRGFARARRRGQPEHQSPARDRVACPPAWLPGHAATPGSAPARGTARPGFSTRARSSSAPCRSPWRTGCWSRD